MFRPVRSLRDAWVNVDPRGWKTRDDMTINVGLGAGGKAQQFAQTMAKAFPRTRYKYASLVQPLILCRVDHS